MERKNEILEAGRLRPLAAGRHGLHAGRPRQVVRRRPAYGYERQPCLRRISQRDLAPSRGRATRVPRLPGTSAPGEGQGGVRPVHVRARSPLPGSRGTVAKLNSIASVEYTEQTPGTDTPGVLLRGLGCADALALTGMEKAFSISMGPSLGFAG